MSDSGTLDEEQKLREYALRVLQAYDDAKRLDKTDPTRVAKMVTAWRLFTKKVPEGSQALYLEEFAKQPSGGGGEARGPISVGRRVDLMAQKGDDPSADGELFIKLVICGSGYAAWGFDSDAMDKKQLEAMNKGSKIIDWDKYMSEVELKDGGWKRLDTSAVGWQRDAGPKGLELMFGGPLEKMAYLLPVGTSGSGSNSIPELIAAGRTTVAAAVEERKGTFGSVHILVKAHSRGAVAATTVANEIQDELKSKKIESKVELVAFDPVPGPWIARLGDVLESAAAYSGDEFATVDTTQYAEQDVSALDESTIIYSIASGYAPGGVTGFLGLDSNFTPQQVLGAKRLIISAQSHSLGLKKGFIFSGRRYRGSDINSLPAGVYVDKNETGQNTEPLVRLGETDSFRRVMDEQIAKLQEIAKKDGKRIPDSYRVDIIKAALPKIYEEQNTQVSMWEWTVDFLSALDG